MKFEQALDRLEKIVAEMEAAELPLDDVLKRYEEGTRLVRFCTQRLEEAEKKIEILAKAKGGEAVTEPFEAGEPARPACAKAKGAAEDKEGKLF
ncbi:MAG: exodeoxyribonuclease VII small subunit [Verrucomicrobiae bacterium]|nr:exodeoxyribonuclease VII small subunit [Verrucomicrobiae bacterium]